MNKKCDLISYKLYACNTNTIKATSPVNTKAVSHIICQRRVGARKS